VVDLCFVAYHSRSLEGEYVGFLLHQLASSLSNQLDTGTVKNVRLLWRGGERERGRESVCEREIEL
jgi:hypothetical protein